MRELLIVVVLGLVAVDVWQAFRGKTKETKIKARQSLVMVAIALVVVAAWRLAGAPLARLLSVDEKWILLFLAVVLGSLGAIFYRKISIYITGRTPKEQYEYMLEQYVKKGDYIAGIQTATKLLAEDPSPRNHYLLGRVNEMNKSFLEALKEYEKAVEGDGQMYSAYNNMGTCYLNLKENEKALEVLEKAYALEKKDPSIPANMAYAYTCLPGREEDAKAYLHLAKSMGYVDKENLIGNRIGSEEKEEK